MARVNGNLYVYLSMNIYHLLSWEALKKRTSLYSMPVELSNGHFYKVSLLLETCLSVDHERILYPL